MSGQGVQIDWNGKHGVVGGGGGGAAVSGGYVGGEVGGGVSCSPRTRPTTTTRKITATKPAAMSSGPNPSPGRGMFVA